MPEVIGIDHFYIATSDLSRAEAFYDLLLRDTLLFHKAGKFTLGSDEHLNYYNRHFGIVIRPGFIMSISASKRLPRYPKSLGNFKRLVSTPQTLRFIRSTQKITSLPSSTIPMGFDLKSLTPELSENIGINTGTRHIATSRRDDLGKAWRLS